MTRLREDIHIHAPALAVFERIADFEGALNWLPPSFRARRVDADALEFVLSLPMHGGGLTRLVPGEQETPWFLDLRSEHSNGTRPAVEGLAWALHQESPQNVHVTLEAEYEPAGGPFGPLLEMAVHAPLRRQALRDTLWRLKQVAEGRGPEPRDRLG